MENKKIVIITLNYNQSRMTLECADSVLNSTYQNFTLIIVDNGSIEAEYDFLSRNIDSRIIVERIGENCGYVGGVNYGLIKGEKYSPDYYMVMNNDTIIDRNAISHLVISAENHNQLAIVSGKVYHFDRPDVIQYAGSFFSDQSYLKEIYPCQNEKDNGQCNKEEERDMIDDIFWLLPKKIYNEVGLYSDYFFLYGEQADYALRAKRKGFKLIFTPEAKIWHKGSITSGDGDRLSPVANFWRKKGGAIYLYRNTKKKFFVIGSTKVLIKLIFKNILNSLNMRKDVDKKSEYAALLGHIYGILWTFNQKPDDGFNPFLK